VIDPDVVLDRLHGLDQGELRLDKSGKFLLSNKCELGDGVEILLDHRDLLLDDSLLDDERSAFLRPRLVLQALLCGSSISFNGCWRYVDVSTGYREVFFVS